MGDIFPAVLLALVVWSILVGLVLWKVWEKKVSPAIEEAKASFQESPLGRLGL